MEESLIQPSFGPILSINEFARRHPDFFVEPIKWTNLHLDNLRFSFTGPNEAMPTSPTNHTKQCDCNTYIAKYFLYYDKYHYRKKYILHLLTAENTLHHLSVSSCLVDMHSANYARYRSGLELYVNSKAVALLKCDALYLTNVGVESAVLERPIVAYIDRGHLQAMRADRYPIWYPISSTISDREARCREKLKKIQPTDPSHDPYIVALLIALAQKKKKSSQNVNSKETVVMSQVLCSIEPKPNYTPTSKLDDELHLYRACIPLPLLDMLDYPDRLPQTQPDLVLIQITSIPFKPLKSLHDRLFTALLPANHPFT